MDQLMGLWEQAWSYLEKNQFASGGLFLGIFGGMVAYFRHLPSRFLVWFWRRVSVEVEVNSKDELFEAVEFWVSRNGMLRHSRNYLAKHRYTPPSISGATNDDGGEEEWGGPGTEKPSFNAKNGIELSAGPGRHWLWWHWRLILLDRFSKEKEKGAQGQTIESFSFTIFTRNPEVARELLAEALNSCVPQDHKVTRVYTASGDYWRVCAVYRSRPMESVILPDGIFEKLETDLGKFYKRRDWYRRLGVPYRRGYLLAGKPGNGKTSSIVALAGKFASPICVIDLSSPFMSDERLRELLSDAPQGAFLLFEDIDAIFRSRESVRALQQNPVEDDNENKDHNKEKNNSGQPTEPQVGGRDRVTFSGLLNALDGVASPEGRVVFMSTNYPERLDPALIRPGRVDLRVDYENANESQLRKLFLRFHNHDDSHPNTIPMADEFARLLGDGNTSMAMAQGLLLQCGEDPQSALDQAHALRPNTSNNTQNDPLPNPTDPNVLHLPSPRLFETNCNGLPKTGS